MASGTINGTTANEYISSKIEWSSKADNTNNRSTVTAALYYRRTNSGYTTYGYRYCSITINGVKCSANGAITITEHEWVKAAEGTVTVDHNSDGTKSIDISAEGYVGGTTLKSTSCSGTAKLDSIPRASTITSAGNVTLGNKCSVKWTPMAKSFRYKLEFSLGDWSYTTGAIHPNATSAYTYTGYTIPLDVAKQITSATTGTMTVTLYTYSDSGAKTQVGSASSKTFTVKVPSNSDTNPSVSMVLSPVGSLPSAFAGLYIQGKTKVKATLFADGKYDADIKSYSMKVEGTSYPGLTSGYLSQYGNIKVYGEALDTRGNVGNTSREISVFPYSKPKITVSVCGRCDSAGNLSDSGTYLRIKAAMEYSSVVVGGVQKNFCMIRYRYKTAAATSYSDWTTILGKGSAKNVDTGALLNGALSADTTYVVEIMAIDDIREYAVASFDIPTETVYMHRTKNAMGLGKYAEGENLLDVGWDARFMGEIFIGADGMTLKDYILAVISEGG